jgi:hypothetical protein
MKACTRNLKWEIRNKRVARNHKKDRCESDNCRREIKEVKKVF